MAGKKKLEKQTASWVSGIGKHSRQIWLAGLGAYARTSTDGGDAFEALVKEGEKAEKQTRGDALKQAETAKALARAKAASKSKAKPVGTGELEDAFDTRLDTAISRLGVPSRNEIAALNTKVDLLMRELERLAGASAAQAPATAPAKPAVAKPARAKSAVKSATVTAASVAPEKKPRARKPVLKAPAAAATPEAAPQG